MTRPIDQADVDAVLAEREGIALVDVNPASLRLLRQSATRTLNAAVALGWMPPARDEGAGNEPQSGQVWQSRDEQYEPGRQVRLGQPIGNPPSFRVTTIANPKRPHQVGTQTRISAKSLKTKWRIVEEVSDAR